MRELTYEEMEQVDGGVAPALAWSTGVGAAHGAYSGYKSGGIPGAVAGAALGAVTGLFGGVAAATTGAVKGMFAVYSFGAHMIGQAANDSFSNR